jgi:hypothetical protein
MVRGIIVAGVLAASLMGAIKDGRVLHFAGLTAKCTVFERFQDGSELDACRPGKLEGMPNLAQRGCFSNGRNGTYEYWRCPAAQASAPLP